MANRSGSSTTAKKICSTCGEEKTLKRGFYRSYNPLHKDGYIPMCKECVIKACANEDGTANDEKVYLIMRQLDKPFIKKEWDQTVSQYGIDSSASLIVGKYLTKINSLPQFKMLDFEQGEKYSQAAQSDNAVGSSWRKTNQNEKVYYLNDEEFEVSEEMIRLFGEGYTSKEYQTMQRIYDDTKQDYPNISSNQKNLLLRYVRFAAKEEIATNSGIIADAEKWSKLTTEALKQLNSIDVQGGVTCFSEFFQKFERVKDVTRILPRFKYRPNDAPDFIIWCYINYCRRLEGKLEVPYEDVYKFYDEKVAEYVKQYGDPYGIFTDDPTLNNREKIKEFIELPPDYYGDNDDEVES